MKPVSCPTVKASMTGPSLALADALGSLSSVERPQQFESDYSKDSTGDCSKNGCLGTSLEWGLDSLRCPPYTVHSTHTQRQETYRSKSQSLHDRVRHPLLRSVFICKAANTSHGTGQRSNAFGNSIAPSFLRSGEQYPGCPLQARVPFLMPRPRCNLVV